MRPGGRTLLLVGAILAFGPARPAQAQDSVAARIRALIDSGRIAASRRPAFEENDLLLDTLYLRRHDRPIWLDAEGYDEDARAAIVALRAADERGLDPEDYDASTLASLVGGPADTSVVGRSTRDVLLTLSIARYLRDLRDGRVPDSPYDPARQEASRRAMMGLLDRAARGTPLERLAMEVEPHLVQYRDLLTQLARYRALADTFRYRHLADSTVRVGQPYPTTAELRRRLIAFGDLAPPTGRVSPTRYDAALAAGVRRFQARHALTPDGVLGPSTRAALEVPLVLRVQQIGLALERLRWLPNLEGSRLLVVNIPAFELFAYDSAGGMETPALRMPVVIGNAFDHQTPVLYSPLTAVYFRPYWNVPTSILTAEYLPQLAPGSRLLRRQQMEVLGPRDSVLGDSLTRAILAGLRTHQYRLRQRPGVWNSLGLSKFTFPNGYDVYLHGTPDTRTFHLERRDASHGCIRVKYPAQLAQWVLEGTAWSRGMIDSAMVGTVDTVRAEPVLETAVLIYYATAMTGPGGEIWFYPDVYGQDQKLLDAIRERWAEGEEGTEAGAP